MLADVHPQLLASGVATFAGIRAFLYRVLGHSDRLRQHVHMGTLGRVAAVTALIDLACSPEVPDRADAGRCLASFTDVPEARRALLGLVLDAHDTFVTLETTVGLLRRQDAAGLEVVAEALASADGQQLDWIFSAVNEALGIYSVDVDAAISSCALLADHPSELVRIGAEELTDMLSKVVPVLRPAGDGVDGLVREEQA